MTEERTVDGAEATPEGSSQQPSTPEQVEAEWKYRVSQKDKAHAAESKALRDQIAALTAVSSSAGEQATGSMSEAEALKRQLAETQQVLVRKDAEFAAQIRTIKYPNAADALDASALAAMDEAKLAGLEARLAAPAPRGIPVDHSTPPRAPASGSKPIEEKTSAELREDLRRMAPTIIAEMGRQPD